MAHEYEVRDIESSFSWLLSVSLNDVSDISPDSFRLGS